MEYEYKVDINAAPEKVWAILEDVDRWPEWTKSMQKVEALDKPLAVGSRVKIKQPKLPGTTMTITAFEANRNFSWQSKSPGLRTDAHHEVSSSTPGTSVTLRFVLSGPLAGIAAALWGSLIRRYVQTEGDGLKARAEQSG